MQRRSFGCMIAWICAVLIMAGCATTRTTRPGVQRNRRNGLDLESLRREQERERQALEVYAGRLDRSNLLLNQVNALMGQINAEFSKGAPAVKAFLDQRLIPSFERYLGALQQIPTHTETIRGLHKQILQAHTRLYLALRNLSRDLSDNNFHDKLRHYRTTQQASVESEKDYREKLTTYFRIHGVDVN